MKRLTFSVLLLSTLSMGGCVSAGIDVNREQLKAFQVGKTTRSEIEAALGRPNIVRNISDGTTVLVYQHVDVRVRGETFIPFVGAFVGGSDMRTNEVTINLDKNGLFESTASATSEQGASLMGSSTYRPPSNP